MNKTSAENDWVDSGAETGGSDYSPMSSTISEVSMGDIQDPFLVSVHLIADPGDGRVLQNAADSLLAWVHPELQLFRVSERATHSQRPHTKNLQNGSQLSVSQPAMAVILFLQEACGGEEHILMLHRALQRPPWHYHHTEEVSSSSRRMLPLTPYSHDFYTLASGTPLWAVRQVHYGKEIVRFTIYCSHDNYADMVRLYKLLLQRRVAQKKEDFCFLVVYSNHDMEVQLSLKRLSRGQSPTVLDSAVMEVRVRDVGALVPLLPNPCSPISEVRWRTEDYDGNKILLQVQGGHFKLRPDPSHKSSGPESNSAPSTFNRSTPSNRIHRHRQRTSRPSVQHQSSLISLPLACEELDEQELWVDQGQSENRSAHWRSHKSSSLFSLPLGSASSTCSSPGPSASPHHRTPSLIPPFRLNVEALIGAEETDVDTGTKVRLRGDVDLTVVSAYIRPSVPQMSRPLSAPPEDIVSSVSPGLQKSSTLGRALVRTHSVLSNSASYSILGSRLNCSSMNTTAAHSLSDTSVHSVSLQEAAAEEHCNVVEDEQEFYI